VILLNPAAKRMAAEQLARRISCAQETGMREYRHVLRLRLMRARDEPT
jgi:hypothetical protein